MSKIDIKAWYVPRTIAATVHWRQGEVIIALVIIIILAGEHEAPGDIAFAAQASSSSFTNDSGSETKHDTRVEWWKKLRQESIAREFTVNGWIYMMN